MNVERKVRKEELGLFVFSWLVLVVALAAQTPSTNWAQFRGNARLTGVATSTLPPALTLKWTYEAGESIESSAAIVDGAVYVGSSKGELLAIDLETGSCAGSTTGDGGFIGESSPAVSADAVFIGDLAGVVHAVGIRDGRKLWTFKTSDEIRSSPVLVDDILLIGSYDTNLYALDSRTGKVRWTLQTDGPVHGTPAVYNGVIYIGGCDEQFRGVRVTDGKTLFALPLGSNMGSSAAIEDRAYIGTFSADVHAIDLRRKVAWTFRDPDCSSPTSRRTDGGIIAPAAVHAIDAATDKRLEVRHARPLFDCHTAGLCEVETANCAGWTRRRQEDLGIRSGRRHHGVASHRRRPRGGRSDRRPHLLLRIRSDQ
jgi:outer membrane protein assembly factor BamB